MARAHMLLLASAREGWGSRSDGSQRVWHPRGCLRCSRLRDSIQHHEQEFWCSPRLGSRPRHDSALARSRLYQELSAAAMVSSATFSFDQTLTRFEPKSPRFSPSRSSSTERVKSANSHPMPAWAARARDYHSPKFVFKSFARYAVALAQTLVSQRGLRLGRHTPVTHDDLVSLIVTTRNSGRNARGVA